MYMAYPIYQQPNKHEERKTKKENSRPERGERETCERLDNPCGFSFLLLPFFFFFFQVCYAYDWIWRFKTERGERD